MERALKCNLCGKELSSLSHLNRHILSRHEGIRPTQNKRFKCNFCAHEFPGEYKLVNHIRKHTGERPFKCTVDDCGMTFKRELVLKYHMKFRHSDERPFQCNFPDCLYSGKTSSELASHKRVHSDDRPNACPHEGCNFRSKFRENLKRHQASVHSETKPFACSKCDYKTASKGDLKCHSRCHSTKRDFKCSFPQCTKSFKCLSSVKRHFTHRHEQTSSVPCDHAGCDEKYANAEALRQHKRFVHSKKSLVCPNLNCNYRTNNSPKLARHVITHDRGNKKLACSVGGCQYKGKHSRALARHMRLHKTLLTCPVAGCGGYAGTEKALKDHFKLHDPSGRPYQCPLCLKRFPKLYHLKHHCVAHTNEKPFSCGHCEYEASRRSLVKTHISSVHSKIQFPFIVHIVDNRECLHCEVTLPLAEFLVHSMGHFVPVVTIGRLDTILL